MRSSKYRSLALFLALLLAVSLANITFAQAPAGGQLGRYLVQIEKLRKVNDYEQAIALIDRALKIFPNNTELLFHKCWCLYDCQDSDEQALAAVDQTLALKGGNTASMYRLQSKILQRLKRYPQAIKAVDQGLVRCQPPIRARTEDVFMRSILYSQRAAVEREQGQLVNAEKDISTAIRIYPNISEHFSLRAQINTLLKRWPQVIQDSKHVIKFHRPKIIFDVKDAYMMMGGAYAAQKDYKNAGQTYLQAWREYPSDRTVLTAAIDFFESIKDKKNADALRKALKSMDEDLAPMK